VTNAYNGLTVFLCGDVMLGRGVDQILPHPGDVALREAYVRDALSYVESAEATNGPIPRPVDFSWPWGDALRLLDESDPDVRIVNLETSVTRSDEFAPGKAVHYRMNPANLSCLAAVRPDACALANNHTLDFGRPGLYETLETLSDAGLRVAGAGLDVREARRPAAIGVRGDRRVLVFSVAMASSGVPATWAATEDRAGIDFVPWLSDEIAAEIAERVRQAKRPGDLTVLSMHWGSNWGYHVTHDQIRFAHALVDGGVDVVHGHSSHHVRPVEVYRDRLILYGCGDLVDDYEGIAGYEEYRDDLRMLYLASLEPDTGALLGLRMAPMQARQMRLRHASPADSEWLRATLEKISQGFGTHVDTGRDGLLALRRP
jgi:poly-gamma-glutamate synthesis protein (capsule biosynthesis protein)